MKEGLIIKCVSPGLELKKNVIRKAVCVVSLGPEKKPEEAEPEAVEGKLEEEGGDAPVDAAAEAAAAAADESGDGSEVEGTKAEEGLVEEEAPPLRDAGAGTDGDAEGEGEKAADA